MSENDGKKGTAKVMNAPGTMRVSIRDPISKDTGFEPDEELKVTVLGPKKVLLEGL